MDADADATVSTDQDAFRGKVALIGLGVTLFAIGQSLLFTIVSPLVRRLGISEIQFGAVISLASLPLVVGAPFWGRRSDVVGRKPVFCLGLVGSALGTVLVAGTLQARLAGLLSVSGLFGCLLVSRAMYSAATSAIYPAAGGYIADVTDFRNRAQGMAIMGASNSLGAIIGPLMAFGLAFAGALVPMYVAAALMVVGAAAAWKILQEPARHRTGTTRSTLRITDPRLRPYMIMWFAFFLTFASVQITTAFYIQDRLHVTDGHDVVRATTFCLVSMATVITLVQGALFQVVRVPPRTALRLAGPAFVVSLLTMSAATTTPVLMAGFAFLGLAFACATPGINGGASLTMAPHEQGAAAGYLAAANTVGAILGPVTGTLLYQFGPRTVQFAGAAAFVVISLYALTIRTPQPPPRA